MIVSPWQIINLLSHFSDVGFAVFLGIVFPLVSKATWTSPPRKEFVTTLANVGLERRRYKTSLDTGLNELKK